ncbi:hypothetical protein [Algoriphagus yeomjeoni]|uniref:Addiction module component n=1 Tax=Algoriphagus yeomjeoni TaxID=291403 RepID=A0A327PFB4_9BACT|nr:hypothetical protein [Algoriphagus yeomjeoni]RAI88486.1 hypothetical protein LV83_02786 [Algoriphagus yeomjeoni]
MDLELQNKKIELIQWLSTLEDSSLIDKLMKFREREKSDWWGAISDEERLSIQKGIDDANEGKLKPNSEAQKIYGKWL